MSKKRQRWSKELIVERIRERRAKGLSLSVGDVMRDDRPLFSSASCQRYFNSYEAAIKAAGLDYEDICKKARWSKKLVIERIRERHWKGLALNSWAVQCNDQPLFQATTKRFGSWEAGIEAAGFAYADVRKNEAWSQELVIERIRERHRSGLPLNARSVLREFSVLIKSARLHFGSWEAAIRAAGFEYANIRKQETWSTQLVIERIRERYSRRLSLSYGDMQQDDPALAGRACYYFGTWEAAVEAAGLSYPRVCKVRRTKDLSRSSKSEDRVTFLQNLGSRKKSRERNPREEKRG